MLSRLMTRREQLVLVFFACAILVGGVVLYVSNRAAPEPGVETVAAPVVQRNVPAPEPDVAEMVPTDEPKIESEAMAEPKSIVVSVQGAVRRPGVFTIRAGDRVQDIIARAGGAELTADTSNINLAARLIDGTTLTVPIAADARDANGDLILRRRTSPALHNPPQYTLSEGNLPAVAAVDSTVVLDPAETESAALVGGLLDLNTASRAQLEGLPGIGPKYAEAIIAYRTGHPFRTPEDVMQVGGIGPKRFDAMRGLVTVR